MNIRKVGIASDHAGYKLKEVLKKHLSEKGVEVIDYGTNSEESVDYPEFGHKLAENLLNGKVEMGVSICGSANGINMTTNKHKGVRGAICWNEEISRLARSHNNANICSLPARFIDENLALSIVDTFLKTDFDGGRHQVRIDKI